MIRTFSALLFILISCTRLESATREDTLASTSKENLVQLNHIYLVVDDATYQAIRDSKIIGDLAYTYEQASQADGQKGWKGFYIRGQNTYIEVFSPQERYPRVGISGIGLGVDRSDALETVYDIFKADHPTAERGNFVREERPWFNYFTLNKGDYYERHSFWVMAYAPECFSENPEDVSRAHYNREKYQADKPLLNVTGFSIALKPEGLKLLTSYLESVGFKKDGNDYMTSEGIRIHLQEEDPTHQGIYEITLSLQRPSESLGTVTLGSSELILEPIKATWTFLKSS